MDLIPINVHSSEFRIFCKTHYEFRYSQLQTPIGIEESARLFDARSGPNKKIRLQQICKNQPTYQMTSYYRTRISILSMRIIIALLRQLLGKKHLKTNYMWLHNGSIRVRRTMGGDDNFIVGFNKEICWIIRNFLASTFISIKQLKINSLILIKSYISNVINAYVWIIIGK